MLARRVLRLAKADRNRHPAHPMVAGFPLETRLRHLANDPANGSSVRELAKLALTGGDTGDATPMSLWMLHDALSEHENADGTTGHPALHWQKWMSAGDKVQLDQHTHRALTEAAEDTRRQRNVINPYVGHNSVNGVRWDLTPEHHATRAAAQLTTHPQVPFNRNAYDAELLDRVRGRVAELAPGTPEKDVDESIRRHALRAQRVFSERHDLPRTAMDRLALLPHGATKELETLSHEIKANDLAARYRRRQGLLRLRRDRARRYAAQDFPSVAPPNARKDLRARWGEFVADPDIEHRIWNHPGGNPSGGYNRETDLSRSIGNLHTAPSIKAALGESRRTGSSDVTLTPDLVARGSKEIGMRPPPGLEGVRLRFDTGVDHVGRTNALTHVIPAKKVALSRRSPRRYALQSGLHGFHEAMHSEPENDTHRMVYADWLEDQGHPTIAGIVRDDDKPEESRFAIYQYGSPVGKVDPGHFYASLGSRQEGNRYIGHLYQRSAADPNLVFWWSKFLSGEEAKQIEAEVARANAPDRYRRVRRYARDLSLRPLNAAVRTLGLGLASALRQAGADPAGQSHIAARLTAGPGPYVADGPRVNHLPLHPSLPVAQLAPADAPRHAAEQYGGLVDRLHQAGHLPGLWHRRLSKMAAALGEIPVGVPSISEGVTSPPVARRPDPGREAKPFARAGVRRYGMGYTHADFHRKMIQNQEDHTTPLVYADYLEDNGMPEAASVIREHNAPDARSGWWAGNPRTGTGPSLRGKPPGTFHAHLTKHHHGSGRFSVILEQRTGLRRVPLVYWYTRDLDVDRAKRLADEVSQNGGVVSGDQLKLSRRRYAAPRRDFLDALRRVRSTQTQALHKVATQVAARLGLHPTTTVPALHDGPGGSVSGIAQAVYGPAKPEAVHQLASWIGLTGRLPGVSVFHVRPTGPDALWKFSATGSGHQLRDRLDRVGLTSRVLIPSKQGYDVLIPDQGRRQERAVRAFARQQGSPLEGSRGHLKTVGPADDADARAKFRTTIEQGERKAV